MANQPEVIVYDAGVYQLEIVDPVQGGVGGKSNQPLLNLANRTAWLKGQVDALNASNAGKAPIASPTFTGNPAAPTPAAGDNSTSLATTAFVQNLVGGVLIKSVAGAGSVTLTAAEAGEGILIFTGALTGARTVVVPTSPTGLWVVENRTTGAFSLTIKTAAGAGVIVPQGHAVQVYCDGVDVLVSTLVTSVAGRFGAITLGVADVSGAAPLASPALTGVPAAPTPAVGTNTTQLATTAFVQAQLASSVPTASEIVQGKVELASAAETATGADGTRAVHPAGLKPLLDLKAPLASPALTGNPTAPTAAQFDNDTSLATTAFVQRAAGNYSSITIDAANRTLTAADVGKYIFCNANNIDLTLPNPASLPLGSVITVVQASTSSGARVLAPAGVTLNGVMDGSTVTGGNMPLTNRALYEFVVVSSTAYQATSYGGANLLAASGYQRLPSGLIIQWGSSTFADAGTTIAFPITFPTACRSVVASVNSSFESAVTAGNMTASNFIGYATAIASAPANWIAIGH